MGLPARFSAFTVILGAVLVLLASTQDGVAQIIDPGPGEECDRLKIPGNNKMSFSDAVAQLAEDSGEASTTQPSHVPSTPPEEGLPAFPDALPAWKKEFGGIGSSGVMGIDGEPLEDPFAKEDTEHGKPSTWSMGHGMDLALDAHPDFYGRPEEPLQEAQPLVPSSISALQIADATVSSQFVEGLTTGPITVPTPPSPPLPPVPFFPAPTPPIPSPPTSYFFPEVQVNPSNHLPAPDNPGAPGTLPPGVVANSQFFGPSTVGALPPMEGTSTGDDVPPDPDVMEKTPTLPRPAWMGSPPPEGSQQSSPHEALLRALQEKEYRDLLQRWRGNQGFTTSNGVYDQA